MKNKSRSITQKSRILKLALIMIALVVSLSVELRAQTNSAPNSSSSDTRASDEGLIRACAEAVEELKAARNLIKSQRTTIARQDELLDLEKKLSAGLKNIRTMDAAEKDELRKALAAKDRAITALESEVKVLKKRKFTIWKAVKIIIVAGSAGIIIGKVL